MLACWGIAPAHFGQWGRGHGQLILLLSVFSLALLFQECLVALVPETSGVLIRSFSTLTSALRFNFQQVQLFCLLSQLTQFCGCCSCFLCPCGFLFKKKKSPCCHVVGLITPVYVRPLQYLKLESLLVFKALSNIENNVLSIVNYSFFFFC